jgi:hypothetical protein
MTHRRWEAIEKCLKFRAQTRRHAGQTLADDAVGLAA